MQRLVQIASRLIGSRWFIFAAALGVAGLSTRGRPSASHDTHFYRELSDAILTSEYASLFSAVALKWTILTFVSLVTLARVISADHWMTIMMIINVLCSALTAVLLVNVVRRITRSVVASMAALAFYLACLDIMVWVRFVLTDIIYSLIAFTAFALVVEGILGERIHRRRLLLAMTLIVALFTRAVGVLLIPLTLFAELVLTKPPQTRPRWLRGRLLVAAIVMAVITATMVRAFIVQDPDRHWPFEFIRPKITEYVTREKMGEVVWGRPETFRPPPHSVTDHVILQMDRTVRFFQFTSSEYSAAHNLLNVAYYVPLYLLVLTAIFDAIAGADWRRRAVVVAATLWVLAYAIYHGLTLLDFDWRYRAPLMLHMIVLASCGVDAVARRISRTASAATPGDSPERALHP